MLKEFTRRVQTVVRTEDILGRSDESLVGRWGGEEFLLVLPQTDLQGACVVGERVRSAVAAAPFSVGDREIEITASGGCSAGTASGRAHPTCPPPPKETNKTRTAPAATATNFPPRPARKGREPQLHPESPTSKFGGLSLILIIP